MATSPPPDDPLLAPPVALTPLIGRERELALALALLGRSDVRLLTLTGPGGIGKTRLALAVTAAVGSDFADGCRFVPLAAVPNAELVTATVARAAGLLDAGDVPVRNTLTTALRHAETLLVLDNFEHVAAAAPLVSDLLATCPRLKILVTSRVLLRVDGEHALPVPPLAVPELGTLASVDSVRHAAAVQLFAQRGQAVSPSFVVTDDNVPLVADICRRLDGVPLAIELAAARLTHLTPSTLSERLERRLPLLTGGGRDRPRRLQTMRDAIAWSYDLLSADERTLFRRLAVFAGGCTLEAAEWVMGDGSWVMGETEDGARIVTDSLLATGDSPSPIIHHPSPAALDLIAALVEASLLHAEPGPDGTTRYRMLETIREFALDCLATSGEEEAVRERYAACFVTFAERNELAELLPDGAQALATLEAEHANLRVALAWLEEVDDVGSFLRLAAALGHFWSGQGYYQEGRDWLERALARGSAAAATDRAKALVALGMIQIYQGENREAEIRLTEGLAGCRDQGDAVTVAVALIGLGGLATMRGDLDRGVALLEESRAASREAGDRRLAGILEGWVSTNLAVVHRAHGDRALAAERLGEALRLHHEVGYTEGIILALGDLGDLARDHGDYARAMEAYQEALGLGRGNPGTRVVTEVIEAMGIVVVAVGQAERGARLMSAAGAQRDRLRLRYRLQETESALERAVAAARSALGEAAFATAWASGRNLTAGQAVVAALDPFLPPSRDSGVSLTPREMEILRLLAAGQTDPAIAAALFISVRTVENHVARIFAKLEVRTRTAAAAAAIATGLVDANRPAPA